MQPMLTRAWPPMALLLLMWMSQLSFLRERQPTQTPDLALIRAESALLWVLCRQTLLVQMSRRAIRKVAQSTLAVGRMQAKHHSSCQSLLWDPQMAGTQMLK